MRWKARLRAWLIDLVREAIRIEMKGYTMVMPSDFADAVIRKQKPNPQTHIQPSIIQVEPSFEQMQAEALKAQEKYYEPERA